MTAPKPATKPADKPADAAPPAAPDDKGAEKKSDARGKADEAIAQLSDAQKDSVLQFATNRAEHKDPVKEAVAAEQAKQDEKEKKEKKEKKDKGEPEPEPLTASEKKLADINAELDKLTDGGLNAVADYASSQVGR